MIPSRGLHALRGTAPRLYQQQCRNLSSRSLSRTSPIAQAPLRTSQWRTRIPATALAVSAIRHASTTPTPPPINTPPHSQIPNIDTITMDDLSLDNLVHQVPESIGYLHSLGLDFGWGMTSVLQWTLEHLHITAGLPWWAAIGAAAIGTRLLFLPMFINSADQNGRQMALMPILKPHTDKITASQRAGDQQALVEAYKAMSAARKRAGLSYTQQFLPLAIQGYVGFCAFRLFRAMSTLPVPGLQTGGFLWLQDLTIPDGYLLLPALMGATMHLMVRWGGETGSMSTAAMNPVMRNTLLYFMPVMITLVTGWQSGAIAIWFAFTGAWGMAQARLLQNAKIRQMLGITPLYKTNTPSSPFPFSSPTTIDVSPVQPQTPRTGSYQAPTLRTSPSPFRAPNTEQVQASVLKHNTPHKDEPAVDIAKAAAPATSGFGSIKAARGKVSNWIKEKQDQTAASNEKNLQKKRAEKYERDHQARVAREKADKRQTRAR